jgi:molybdate transport system ATP-binding protein
MSGLIHFAFTLRQQDFQLQARAELPDSGVSALFGPSGCGKSTVLRCIAGLESGVEGALSLAGESWFDSARGLSLPTHKREIGFVFQETALFPHLKIKENLLYGWRRTPQESRRHTPQQVIEMLGLGDLLGRYPAQLSGGEGQRVAIGRALLNSPRLLLMDEPMAALDRRRKREILPYLERLRTEAKIPVIYVTHDIDELISVADHLALMDNGRIIRCGPLAEMLVDTSLSISMEENAGALIAGKLKAQDPDYHLSELEFAGGRLIVSQIDRPLGTEVKLRIHAKDVSIALAPSDNTSILNILPARVIDITPQDASRVIVRMELEGIPLLARITQRSLAALDLKPGMEVFAQIKSVALHT